MTRRTAEFIHRRRAPARMIRTPTGTAALVDPGDRLDLDQQAEWTGSADRRMTRGRGRRRNRPRAADRRDLSRGDTTTSRSCEHIG
jgi:hypothetical protein